MVSRGTDDRALLKNMTGAVRDLAFAHTANETLLAVVDEVRLTSWRATEDGLIMRTRGIKDMDVLSPPYSK